jgi:large repetitive protein
VSLRDGAYVVFARASNLGGTSPASGNRVVQVDSTPPPPPVIAAPVVAGTTVTVSGTAESGTTVELFEDGSSRGTVATSGGRWSRSLSGVGTGTRSYTARAVDFAGNVSTLSAPAAVLVNP